MAEQFGANDSRQLPTGEEVHLVRPPGRNWRVRSYDWSWVDCQILKTKSIASEVIGWTEREFDSADDAYSFVSTQIRDGRAPGVPAAMQDFVLRRN